ncbi:hypothetical protein IGI04_039976 [Brassica rapa subsp. trilocularis]|uniref:Uncharacterized protein n=1 Tax=Brassica rapa subsp. trilocularis TaxID=1813537 RepID=A0ABQ7KPH6_BRACM|nr:hypothetical protein IGI04_039976 [Brassica rapa subsp. trilocularis]
MVTVLFENQFVSESYPSPVAKRLGVWSGNLHYHVVGRKHHQADSSDGFVDLCYWLINFCFVVVVLLWHGRYGYLCVLPTRFPLPVRLKLTSFGFKVSVDRWCCCVVDQWWIV